MIPLLILGALALFIITNVATAQAEGLFDDMSELSHDDIAPPAYVVAFGQGIAVAEGYMTADGTTLDANLAARNNNPGDILQNGVNIAFPTASAGWNACYRQLELIFNNTSRVYNSDMTIAEVAQKWTGGDNPNGWARAVAQYLGMDVSNTMDEVKGQYA